MELINLEFTRKKCKVFKDVIPLPANCIGGSKIIGKFNHICVEIQDEPSVIILADRGCFGRVVDSGTKLILSLVEAFFLQHALQNLQILDKNDTLLTDNEAWQKFCEVNINFAQHFVVYSYYRAQNWVVKSGIKFGGDFLLYKYGPQYFHASFLVFINTNNKLQTIDLQRIYRVAETTGKDTLIASVHYPNCPVSEYLKNIKQFQITETVPKRFVQNGERENYSK